MNLHTDLFAQALQQVFALAQTTGQYHLALDAVAGAETGHLVDNGLHHACGDVLPLLPRTDVADDLALGKDSAHGTDGSVWGGNPDATPYLNAISIDNKGKTLDLSSNESFEAFIKNVGTDAYESEFAMYRWCVKTNSKILSEKIGGVGRITGLTVAERGPGGIAKTLKVVGTEGDKNFTTQSKIRSILGNASLTYTRNDESEYSGWETLPSAFIYIENNGTDTENVTWFTIYGGDGAGMSQNAAQGMAKAGKRCMDILHFFYKDCDIIDIGEVS